MKRNCEEMAGKIDSPVNPPRPCCPTATDTPRPPPFFAGYDPGTPHNAPMLRVSKCFYKGFVMFLK